MPANGSTRTLVSATSSLRLVTSANAYASKGGEFLAVLRTASSSELVSLSADGKTETKLAQASAGTLFPIAFWSPDASQVAYFKITPSRFLPLAPDGKAYYTRIGTTSTFTLRSGVTLPNALRPQAFVVSAQGAGSPQSLGPGTSPLAFSPDGTYVLVNGPSGLTILPTNGGSGVSVKGISSSPSTSFSVSADGAYLAAQTDGAVTVYSFDWNTGQASSIGSESNVPAGSFPVFGPNGSFLIYDQATGKAAFYQVQNNAISSKGSYSLMLPARSAIAAWLP
jgi:Tol biopolymer transport system component